MWWRLNGCRFKCRWNIYRPLKGIFPSCVCETCSFTSSFMFPSFLTCSCVVMHFPQSGLGIFVFILSIFIYIVIPHCARPENKLARRCQHTFMSMCVCVCSWTITLWTVFMLSWEIQISKSSMLLKLRILHSLMFYVLWRLFLFPEAELGHPLFSSPCYGRSQRHLFPSIILDILFLSFLCYLSPPCFSLSSYLHAQGFSGL